MANHKSAIKKLKQDIVRRERNRTHRSRMRTQIKKFRKLLEAGDAEGALLYRAEAESGASNGRH
jgi:small subunit ribosomal protein S20